ncbi:MAG: aminotransferase class III-fold pyridoxal phosphate-dependent enzyme [Geminicoccaceae bacterium]
MTIDRRRLRQLRLAEEERFRQRTPTSARLTDRAERHLPGGVPMSWMRGLFRTPPLYVSHGEGPRFVDVDGNAYLDFNLCDLSMTMGYGAPLITRAVAEAAARGAHYLLPVEGAIEVAEMLAARVGMPFWQFTLSASGANTEVIRIARTATGRETVILFGGHYHGHLDDTLVIEQDGRSVPSLLGLPSGISGRTEILPFNDLGAVEARLARGDVALVLTEPALTNCNLVLPQPGFLAGLRDVTRRHGTLLCLDEAHTFQFAYGGLVGAWSLEADFVVLGKGLGSGIPFGLYGMSEEIAGLFRRHLDVDIGPAGIATGGTTYASAVAIAAARAALRDVLTPEGYARLDMLGGRLAGGLDDLFARHGLPWRAFRLGPRSGYCLSPDLPRNGAEAAASLDVELIDTRRVFMANRGCWDAVASAGPQASAHDEADIDAYLAVADAFLAEITGRTG